MSPPKIKVKARLGRNPEVGKAVQGMNRQELEYKGLFNVREKVIKGLTKDKESAILCMNV